MDSLRRAADADDDARRDRLVESARALGLTIAPQMVDKLMAYLGLLQRWNKVYNLTSLRDPDAMLGQHMLDCLAVLPALQRHAGSRPLRVLDVGSGGGLPGVVLAVTHADWQVTCIDAVAKKAGFVRQVASELALPNLHSLHARVETVGGAMQFDVIVARAFASLADFVRLTRAALAPGGVWLAMKGRTPDEEIAALAADIEVFHVEPLQVPGLAVQRCIVWLRVRPGA